MAWIYGYPSKNGAHLGPENLPNSPPRWWGLGHGAWASSLELEAWGLGAWACSRAWGLRLGEPKKLGAWGLELGTWGLKAWSLGTLEPGDPKRTWGVEP